MEMYYALNDGKAHAGTLVLLRPMQPLEHLEQLVGVLHVKAHAVVFDVVDGLTRV